jgi:hypothetical protein
MRNIKVNFGSKNPEALIYGRQMERRRRVNGTKKAGKWNEEALSS